jgi:hypothetical protein
MIQILSENAVVNMLVNKIDSAPRDFIPLAFPMAMPYRFECFPADNPTGPR